MISPLIRPFGDPLVATDALGRELPTYEEVGNLKPDRYVGLFYWLWHTPLRNDTPDFDLTEILKRIRTGRIGLIWPITGDNPSWAITALRTNTCCRSI